eukprot:CAMPEP_0202861200 /NCGR_PEP_ID=MMETSP1391-20130828/2676_1 /ASSEMBLY_ACC=CAM_ASM_000867 /TAXON_ID=1034604 /ORGANISM="Chlamydomonas leiostraca, Strain SAG 11-49" /LENGTH=202 /DNA_ID=CAMNT_0049540543 /DNA_START=303 /DNA_END=911 /DNA_ORIENTATION=-
MAQAMAGSDDSRLFCAEAEQGFPRWRGIVLDTLLGNPAHRIIHAMGDVRASQAPSMAIAYWYPEEHVEVDESGPLPAGWVDLGLYMRPEAQQAQEELFAALTEGKKAFLTEVGAFLYVAFLGTAPACQGQGLGGRMLAHLTVQADAAGKHAYIEAASERNAQLYERYGFRRRGSKTWSLPGAPGSPSLTLTFMSRPPQSQPQ